MTFTVVRDDAHDTPVLHRAGCKEARRGEQVATVEAPDAAEAAFRFLRRAFPSEAEVSSETLRGAAKLASLNAGDGTWISIPRCARVAR